ncbi:MAG: site-specific integrase [Ktedonobacteraceae bacterium]|nr:site-specific integrase [Ktedonobacteraceae bacterium]
MVRGKRAGRGEGSVYQRKGDKRWVASFIVEETGKRQYIYKDTRKEAYDALHEALQAQKQGMLASGPKQKLKDYLEQWFEEVHRLDIRDTTYIHHYRILHKHIIPPLGHVQLQRLTPQQVQRLYTNKLQEGLAPSTIRNIHKVLRNALENAVRWNLIVRNPCSQVTLPPLKKRDTPILTVDQAQHLLSIARGSRIECLISLMLATGIRHGEMAALQWQDIDFTKRCLYIRRSVSRRGGIEGKVKGGYILGEPKTKSSKREIMLPNFVVNALKAHRIRQNEERLKAGGSWQDQDLVFCNRHGGFLYPDHLLERFHKILEEAGLPPMRLHDLRHNIATLLSVKMKNPSKLVQDLLGHENEEITKQVYTHSDPSELRKMMDDLDTLFGEDLAN